MLSEITKQKANLIFVMEQQLENELLKDKPEKLWSESYIKRQIDRRRKGDTFDIKDHIRAMVYSMLSSVASWDRIAKDIPYETSRFSGMNYGVPCGYRF